MNCTYALMYEDIPLLAFRPPREQQELAILAMACIRAPLVPLIVLHLVIGFVSTSRTAEANDTAFLGFTNGSSHRSDAVPSNRSGKMFSMFQVVRFNNDACMSTDGNKNGTCYTAQECTSKGGVNGGSCAQGYGVCCVVTLTCGGVSSLNNTYFEGPGLVSASSCSVKICRTDSDICQLRLDFTTFSITGPSTSTSSSGVTTTLNGSPNAGGVAASSSTACLTDTFSVTSPGNAVPPVICGTNTGEHMYVEASTACNNLAFELGQNGTSRQWNIKIIQYSCDYTNLAPEGCTQYYYGLQSSCVMSYNFQGNGAHLNNQNQNICVRKEKSFCRICWSTATPTDFQVSGSTIQVDKFGVPTCCQYGTGKKSFDCVSIPGAEKKSKTGVRLPVSRFCGRSKGLVTSVAGTMAGTVCSNRQPFSLRFLSDTYDLAAESIAMAPAGGGTAVPSPTKGFKLCFIQNSDSC